MNIALEQTEEYFNGTRKNTYADTFIRGNNGMTLGLSFQAYYYHANNI